MILAQTSGIEPVDPEPWATALTEQHIEDTLIYITYEKSLLTWVSSDKYLTMYIFDDKTIVDITGY